MITQGKAFMKYREKNKNKYEGFRQRKIDTPVYDQSQQVYENTQIMNVQPNSELIQSQNDTLSNYSNTFNNITSKTQDYVNRISSSNPYLNKFIRFTNGTIAYVTNLGVAKPISSSNAYQSLLGKNGCPTTVQDVPLEWSPSYIEGSIIPLNPTLVVGSPMNEGESCGNEGKNVFVSSLISKDAISAYQGCYQDASPSIMTFIGESPPVQIDASIVNGDFSQPQIPTNTVKYTTSDTDFSKIPGWEFDAILNNGVGWSTLPTPFPYGPQCALIQYKGHITQSVNFSVGTYNLVFAATGRQTGWNTESNNIDVLIDNVVIYSVTPSLGKWDYYNTKITINTSGNHNLTFQGQGNARDTSGGYDVSSAIQGITINLTGESASMGGNYTPEQCKTAAIDGGYQYFGLQYGNPSTGKGYCAVTNDYVGATKNGTSYAVSGGIKLWASETSGIGNTATISLQGSISVINSESMSIFNIPNNNDKLVYQDPSVNGGTSSDYIGCYGDTGDRAIANTSNDQYLTLSECKKLAIDKQFTYYGWQYNRESLNGWCVGSNDMNQINKYGPATNCTKLSDGTMGGGAWSNAMYKTNYAPSDYYLILQDDGNLVICKGTGPNNNQGTIWTAMTNGQQQKPNPAFAASKGKFGKNYIKTGDTLAAGDFIGSNDGSIYLLMQSDGNLVLYTSQSVENCTNIVDVGQIGGQGATALYTMSEVGIPANLGKIGYVDKNSEIYSYPDNKIGLSNTYMRYPESDSYGYDIPGAASSGPSLDQCKNTCNNLSECYGFTYQYVNNICFPKDKNMFPVGSKQPLPGADLYVREKMVKEGFETVEIDTNKWKNYANNNKTFDDSIVDSVSKQLSSADKKELSDLNDKINRFSQEIELNNVEYKQNLSNVNTRTVENTGDMNNYNDEYDKIQLKIKHSGTNLINMNNIVSDSSILVIQQNAHYVLYATMAIILLLIAIKFLS